MAFPQHNPLKKTGVIFFPLFVILAVFSLFITVFSSSLSLEYALRESGCRIGYEPRSLLAVDFQGHQRGSFCIVPFFTTVIIISSILITYLACATNPGLTKTFYPTNSLLPFFQPFILLLKINFCFLFFCLFSLSL